MFDHYSGSANLHTPTIPTKKGTKDALKSLADAGVFGARRISLTGTFGKVSGAGKGSGHSGTGRPGPHPSPLKAGGWPVSA